MKYLLSIIIIFSISLNTQAGTKYIRTLTGSPTITMTSPVSLVAGDSLFILGSLGAISFDNTLHDVYINCSGATFNVTKCFGCLAQVEWAMHNCKIVGITSTTSWYVNIRMHKTHNNSISCHIENNSSNISDQPLFQWDWPYNSDMVYTGSLAQTYYKDTITNSYIGGFVDVVPVQMSSPWGGGTEPNRSFCNEFKILSDTFMNISRTGGGSIGAITGTGFQLVVDKSIFKYIDGPASTNSAHNETILWYGTATIIRNTQEDSYASLYRSKPFASTILSGIYRNDSCIFIGNKIIRQRSYTPTEAGISGMGNRDAAHGFFQCKFISAYNTVFSTHERSYNFPFHYYGFAGMDSENNDTSYANYNAGSKIEFDWADFHASWDSVTRGFVIANVGTPSTQRQTIGNRVFPNYASYIFVDTVNFHPGDSLKLSTPGKYYNVFDKDIEGNVIPLTGALYAGALQPTSLPVPNCTSNLTPTNTSTVITSTSAVASWTGNGADGYKVFVSVNGSPFSSTPDYTTTNTSISFTNLVPGIVYKFYVKPYNVSGDAIGCATSFTTFSTKSLDPVLYRVIRIKKIVN